jgi:hypothetical protein
MRISCRAFIIAALATGLFAVRAIAQDPPAKPAARPAAKKPELALPAPEPLTQPEPGVSKQSNVNIRAQAAINSEVIGRLQPNDPVTILELVTLKKPKQDEPAHWYRIALPTNVAVWVNTSFLDLATKTVKPRRLNLRGGPGENYSIVGRLDRGTVVNPIDAKGDWTKIEAPTNASAFVAAHLLERVPVPAIVATPPAVAPPPTNPPPVLAEVKPATEVPATPETPVAPPVTTPPVVTTTDTTPPVTAPAVVFPDGPVEKVKKIVSREGILRGSVSIQAPTYFELRSLDTGKTINYVFSPSTNLMLRQFRGQRIIVTGEELLDERWQNTPVLVVDALQTVP